MIYREYTECYSISCSFFTSHPYILSKICMFLFTSLYPFFSPNFERAKVNNIPIFREPSDIVIRNNRLTCSLLIIAEIL